MPTLSNILRRALGRPLALRLGALQWLSRDRLSVCLHEPGETLPAVELTIHFHVSGELGFEVVARLTDVCGDPAGERWFWTNIDTLVAIYDEETALRPTSAGACA